MRNAMRAVSSMLSLVVIAVMGITLYYQDYFPEKFYVFDGQQLEISTKFNVQFSDVDAKPDVATTTSTSRTEKDIQLKLFGIVPIRQARVDVVDKTSLIPCGNPFGIKMLTEGVLVVGMNDFDSQDGLVSPAKSSGLKLGDIIQTIDDKPINSNQEISKIVNESQGKSITINYTRNQMQNKIEITPVKSTVDSKYKIGLWVRDSSAGIGTITFYEPTSQVFGGLGHAVCDVDTGLVMPLSSGEVVDVDISGVNQGAAGSPGELVGMFSSDKIIGDVKLNTECGVFGEFYDFSTDNHPIKMALKQEIKPGKAKILTTISGNKPEEFDIEIEKINMNESAMTKNMIVKVTDKDLLEKTGGIVQGMSGSPIIQDGKLVGAVTHVFVNDPTKGYGIFSENMYSFARTIDPPKLKKAS